jgi:hypothetical protein
MADVKKFAEVATLLYGRMFPRKEFVYVIIKQ